MSENTINQNQVFERDISPNIDPNNLSDGFHTFGDLYEMRCAISAALFNILGGFFTGTNPVKSWRHSDGELCFGGGWFIVHATLDNGNISFHYQEKDWDKFKIPEVEKAPEWDGHSSYDVMNRLLEL